MLILDELAWDSLCQQAPQPQLGHLVREGFEVHLCMFLLVKQLELSAQRVQEKYVG